MAIMLHGVYKLVYYPVCAYVQMGSGFGCVRMCMCVYMCHKKTTL